MGQVDDGATEDFIMVASSYQHAYGNLYSNPTEVFEPAYASESIPSSPTRPTSIPHRTGTIAQKRPVQQHPAGPEFASITPATAPAQLAGMFAAGFGTGNLVTTLIV